MNILTLVMLVFFAGSCTNENPGQTEELEMIKANGIISEEGEFFLEGYLHQYYLENEMVNLECMQDMLVPQIENGNDDLTPQLEETQMLIKENLRAQEYLGELLGSFRCPSIRDGKCPKPKTGPCTEGEREECNMSCPIRTPDVFEIWIATSQESDVRVKVMDTRGNECGAIADISPVEGNEGLSKITIETDNCGEGYLEITKRFEVAQGGSVTYAVPLSSGR